MTTPAAHLSIRNQVITVRKWFKTNFTSAITNLAWSFGETVDMDNKGGNPYVAGIEVYDNQLAAADTSFELVLRLIMRDAPANDPVKGDIMTLIDDCTATMRKTGGRLQMMNYSSVDAIGETPATLPTSLIVVDANAKRGEPWRVESIVKDGPFWTCKIYYRFRLVDQMAGADNI